MDLPKWASRTGCRRHPRGGLFLSPSADLFFQKMRTCHFKKCRLFPTENGAGLRPALGTPASRNLVLAGPRRQRPWEQFRERVFVNFWNAFFVNFWNAFFSTFGTPKTLVGGQPSGRVRCPPLGPFSDPIWGPTFGPLSLIHI